MATKKFEIQQPEQNRRFQVVSSNSSGEPVVLLSGDLPSFERIIRKIPHSTAQRRNNREDQKVVAFDRRTGSGNIVTPAFSFRAFLMPTQEYYWVDTYPNVTPTQHYRVNSPAYGSIEFMIQLEIGVVPGQEAKAVETLARRDQVEVQMKDNLLDWVKQEVISANEVVFQNFGDFRTRLANNLTTQAARNGLRLNARIYLRDDVPPPVARIDLTADQIQMQPFQYTDFISLGFDVVLRPDSNSESLTSLGLQRQAELREQLSVWLQEFVRAQVTYNLLTTELHTSVREGLVTYWNNGLRNANKGWKVVELRLRMDDAIPESFRFERQEVTIALSNTEIKLTNTVILNLEDAQLFKNARVTDLEEWTRQKLVEVAQNILATKTYAEVASQLPAFRDVIRTELDQKARQIGYRVEYLITSDAITRFQPDFGFEFEDEDQDFQTTLDRVKLNVVVNGRIADLNHHNLHRYLTPETNLVAIMKKDVHRLVRQTLMRLNPNDFYTKFESKVGPRLVSEIRNFLVNEFNVEPGVDIFPKWQDSYLLQRLRNLQKGFHYAEISYLSGAVMFRIKYGINAVDPKDWPRFAVRNFSTPEEEIDSVSEELRRFIENMLRQRLTNLVTPGDPRLTEVVARFAEEASERVKENTGLILAISGVEQLSNILSNKSDEQRVQYLAEQIDNWRNDIRALDDKIRRAEDGLDSQKEIDMLKEKKANLEKKLLGSGYQSGEFAFGRDTSVIDNLLGTGNTSSTNITVENTGQATEEGEVIEES